MALGNKYLTQVFNLFLMHGHYPLHNLPFPLPVFAEKKKVLHIIDTQSTLTLFPFCVYLLDLTQIVCYKTRSWQPQSMFKFLVKQSGNLVINCPVHSSSPTKMFTE